MSMIGIQDISFKGKRVLIRVDFNVPLDQAGNITDDSRMRHSLPTIKKVMHDGGMAILIAHLGRPNGAYDAACSLRTLRIPLAHLLDHPVLFCQDCIGSNVQELIKNLKPGDVVLLENLRFHQEETSNSPIFAQHLADLADVYVNDAFGVIHRDHASVHHLPYCFKECVAGHLLQKEVHAMEQFFDAEQASSLALIGGNKLEDKLEAIVHLTHYVANLCIVGGLVAPYYQYKMDHHDHVGDGMHQQCKIWLPVDLMARCRSTVGQNKPIPLKLHDLTSDYQVVDIGPDTQNTFASLILAAKTILWVGPAGIFEQPDTKHGTQAIVHAIAQATSRGAYSMVGGGNTAAAIQQLGSTQQFSHISTGGGALLAYFIARKKLKNLEPFLLSDE